MCNLEEMDEYNLPKLNQEEIENLNWDSTSTEIKTVIKNLPTNKSPGPDGFTGEFYQKFREELTPILLKLFQKIAKVNCQTILWDHHHPNTKTRQRCHTKRQLQANITDEYRSKNFNKILANKIKKHIKKIIHHDQVGFIPGMQGFSFFF